MKKLLLAFTAGLMAVSCIIIGSGTFVGTCTEEGIDYTEVRDVAQFNAIVSSLPCNLYYVQGNQQEVRIESTEEFAGKVLTEVEGGQLKLKLQEGRYPKLILRVFVTSPDIESLSVSGSGNLIHEGVLHASKDLNLRVSGSGDIRTGDIDSRDFNAHISGSGSLRAATVSCAGAEVSTSGSGSIDIEALTASGNASARVSGSGRIRLHELAVDGDLGLRTSGSGGIVVNGRCRDVSATTSGSGSISGDLSYTSIQSHTSGSGHIKL